MRNDLLQLVLRRLKQFACVLLSKECRGHGHPREAMKLPKKVYSC